MTKINFENKLFQLNNNQTLEYRKQNSFDYETNKNTVVHLYYNDNGHIGTWVRGGIEKVFEERL